MSADLLDRQDTDETKRMPLFLNQTPLFAASSTWLTPLWIVGVGAIAALAVLLVSYTLVLALMDLVALVIFRRRMRIAAKVGAIALTTAKEGLSQPLFFVALFIGVSALVAFPFIPYNTFGEDVKVVKDSGLTLIMVLAVIVALWTASKSISEEIEGRTALTLLSKPITRWQFMVGKFFGVIGPVALLFIVLGALFLTTVSYKVVYDARENSSPEPTTEQCRGEMLLIVPGLVLAFLEAVALASISVAIATRLPMLANLTICAAVYVVGHITPLLAQSTAAGTGMGRALVQFMGVLIGTVLPNLDNFNIYAAVSAGREVPLVYVAWTALYCALYSSAAILVGLFLFHDRDLA